MRTLFTFKQVKKGLSNTFIPLVCIIVIMLLTASCSTVSTKQTASNSLTTKEKSDNEKTASAMDRLECRTVEVTGTRFKRKVCEYKETWAAIDKKNEKEAEQFVRGIQDESNTMSGEANDGSTNTPMSPWGQ